MDLSDLVQELKELEEEEKAIKMELEEKYGDLRGCIVPKTYPHENGKVYGPYYYLVWKEGGKTRWKNLGTEYPRDLAEKLQKKRELQKRLRKIRERKKELKKLIKSLL